ncbi:MAG: hypothetical protein IJB31_06505 [Akkermansia sp.]|nr:hypothetical protein [Akkermansia sp.]
MKQASKNKLFIYDCCIGKLRASGSDFMDMGAAEQNTFRLHMNEPRGGSFAIRGDVCRFYPNVHISSFSLNGKDFSTDCDITIDTLHLMVVASGCFLIWFGNEEFRPDFSPFDPTNWYVYNKEKGEWMGPFALKEMADMPDSPDNRLLATFPGLDGQAFYLKDIRSVAKFAPEIQVKSPTEQKFSKQHPSISRQNIPTQDPDKAVEQRSGRDYVCPHCHHKFTENEILSIAVHHNLRGDDILGHSAMRRFLPSSFDAQGIPTDEYGATCPESACPACHLHLPPFFRQTTQHIVPIVGSSGAGKTYYLLSLIHQMESDLPKMFNSAFRDADPSGNSVITHMKHKLFSASTPQQAYVGNTGYNGKLYQPVWSNGEFQNQPKPFIFNINNRAKAHSLVLYDSAGDAFMPNKEDERHRKEAVLRSPSGCLFLYDPCADSAFVRLLGEKKEIETPTQQLGSQTTILTETELRLRLHTNTPPGERLPIPLAFIVGKADIWQHLMGPESLLPAIYNGKVITEHIETNSKRIRQFLFNINPSICTNAEAIAERVCYFAVSSLGAEPVRFRDPETGEILTAPSPAELRPKNVTHPLLWILSQCKDAPLAST